MNPTQQNVLNHQRYTLYTLAKNLLVEARECSALSALSRNDPQVILQESEAQANQMGERLTVALQQETIGHEFSMETWNQLIFYYRKLFVMELLQTALDIVNRKQ